MAQETRTGKTIDFLQTGLLLFLGYETLKLFGVIDSKEDKENAANAARLSAYRIYTLKDGFLSIARQWEKDNDKKLPKNGATDILIGAKGIERAHVIAEMIHESKKRFNDNEELLYSGFRAMGNIAQLYFMNEWFKKYGEGNIFDYISIFTNVEQQAQVVQLMDTKPIYYGGKVIPIGKKKSKLKDKLGRIKR